MDHKLFSTRNDRKHEIAGLLVMAGLLLGAATLRYAVFLSGYFG